MELGTFSVSLAVKDLATSKAFYEKLGFKEIGGDGEHWQIMRNSDTVIGLFQGMFEKNILTFNPGWSAAHTKVTGQFTDVRELRDELVAQGVTILVDQTQETDSGPAHIAFEDPDGNPVLIDQHV